MRIDGIRKSSIPEGKKGIWEIQKFTVSKHQAKRFNFILRIESIVEEHIWNREIRPGTYRRLMKRDENIIMMSDTPAELRDMKQGIEEATGNVLVFGLGLGIFAENCAIKKSVKSVTVIEVDQDVIDLVAPHLTKKHQKIEVFQGDVFTYKPQFKYDFIFVDIWPFIDHENLTDMRKIKRRLRNKTEKISCWCENECRQMANVMRRIGK